MSLITYLTRIHFADHVLEDALPEEMRRLGVSRPLIIWDSDTDADEGLARLEDALPRTATPTRCPVSDIIRSGGAGNTADAGDADSLLAIGSAVALRTARQLARHWGRPVVAVPVTPAAIGIEPADGAAPLAMPVAVLCDPTLTRALRGAQQPAETGMDALSHCIEAYLANTDNPPADGMALDGVRRAARHLERWVAHRDDPEARREMMAVGLNGALAAQKGLGAAEALARALDEPAGEAHHGRHHAALLPLVLAFNEPALARQRLADLAQALDVAAPEGLAAAVASLGRRLGLSTRLPAPADRVDVARRAAADPASRSNPRHLTIDDYAGLLARAQAA
jgi:alcohol dehydrogenase class IV